MLLGGRYRMLDLKAAMNPCTLAQFGLIRAGRLRRKSLELLRTQLLLECPPFVDSVITQLWDPTPPMRTANCISECGNREAKPKEVTETPLALTLRGILGLCIDEHDAGTFLKNSAPSSSTCSFSENDHFLLQRCLVHVPSASHSLR